MVRLGRLAAELTAVSAVATAFSSINSRRGKASALARKVLAELGRELERDPFLSQLEEMANGNPCATLAAHVLDRVIEGQVDRLRARQDRIISILEQRSEVSAIAADLELSLCAAMSGTCALPSAFWEGAGRWIQSCW